MNRLPEVKAKVPESQRLPALLRSCLTQHPITPQTKCGSVSKKTTRTISRNGKSVAFQQKKAGNEVVTCASKPALKGKRIESASWTENPSEVRAKVPGYQEPLDLLRSCLTIKHVTPQKKCGSVTKKTTETVSTNYKFKLVENEDQLERRQYQAALATANSNAKKQEERIRALTKGSEALKKEKVRLEHQVKDITRKLDEVTAVCRIKQEAILRRAGAVDYERREKECKVKEVLEMHKQKIQAIEERHKKSEIYHKAKIESLGTTRDKLAHEKERDRIRHLKALQAEKAKSQQLEEKLRLLQAENNILTNDKIRLKKQLAATEIEMHRWLGELPQGVEQ